MIRSLACLGCLLLSVSDLSAQANPEPAPTRLVLMPAKPPVPSLRFTLLPELREQTPGNGALLYLKAGELLTKIPPGPAERPGLHQMLLKWEQMPLAELPREEVARTLTLHRDLLDLLHRGARSENCNFEIIQRIREQGFSAT